MILLYFFAIAMIFAASAFFIKNKRLHIILAIAYSILLSGITVYAWHNLNSYDSVFFRFDSLSVLLNGLLCIVLTFVFYHSKYYLERHVPELKMRGRFVSLLIILATALSSIYFTDNIVLVWVSLEITTIAVTFLIYHERYTVALEAAWKYLFISSFGITIAFIGILFLSVQGSTGHEASLSYSHLQSMVQNIDPLFLKAAFLLLVTGYSVKMNIFPLYTATIDAKTTAPFPVNAIASTALLNAGFIAIFRIYALIAKTDSATWANHFLLIVGIISLLIVTIQLFKVRRFKRMYAFSSMEHMALVTIAITLGKPGIYAALLHLVLHTLAKTGVFLHFGQIRAYYQSGWIHDSGDYMKRNGRSALVYILGLLTITAIPPSGMFLSELLIFKALFAQGYYIIAVMIIVMLTIIIYILFKYSMRLLYGKLPEYFQHDKVIVNKYEPFSQILLFGLVFYLAYFPPAIFTELLHSVLDILN